MNCRENIRHKKIPFDENRSKLTLFNPNRIDVTRIRVDGCEINEGIRCDYLLLKEDEEIFIELKGTDLNHALRQIVATMQRLSEDLPFYPKRAYIICTKTPLVSSEIQSISIKFRKKYSCKLVVRSSPFVDML